MPLEKGIWRLGILLHGQRRRVEYVGLIQDVQDMQMMSKHFTYTIFLCNYLVMCHQIGILAKLSSPSPSPSPMKEEKLISTRLTMLLNLITSKMRLHSSHIKPQNSPKNCNLVHIELGPNFKTNPSKKTLIKFFCISPIFFKFFFSSGCLKV